MTLSVSGRVFSGIQPTGVPHLGNYIGALRQWKSLASRPNSTNFFSIVDLHAITSGRLPNLTDDSLETAASLFAILGRDADVFMQSHVSGHAELAWYFSSCAQFGDLQRMTQWKAKSNHGGDNCGLFTYPILQAADIALYNADIVPVGRDQLQHLELARGIIARFNNRYGLKLALPAPFMGDYPKIMALNAPLNKMSKSDALASSRISLTDSPDIIRSKIKKAVTDSSAGISYDPATRPGISNLVNIMSALTGSSVESVVDECKHDTTLKFKSRCADCVIEHLEPFRNSFGLLMEDRDSLLKLLRANADKASEVALVNLMEIRKQIGFVEYK